MPREDQIRDLDPDCLSVLAQAIGRPGMYWPADPLRCRNCIDSCLPSAGGLACSHVLGELVLPREVDPRILPRQQQLHSHVIDAGDLQS